MFISVEVEAGSDQLRDEQINFLDELKSANGLAFEAYDFTGFVQSFKRRGLHLVAVPVPNAPRFLWALP